MQYKKKMKKINTKKKVFADYTHCNIPKEEIYLNIKNEKVCLYFI